MGITAFVAKQYRTVFLRFVSQTGATFRTEFHIEQLFGSYKIIERQSEMDVYGLSSTDIEVTLGDFLHWWEEQKFRALHFRKTLQFF